LSISPNNLINEPMKEISSTSFGINISSQMTDLIIIIKNAMKSFHS